MLVLGVSVPVGAHPSLLANTVLTVPGFPSATDSLMTTLGAETGVRTAAVRGVPCAVRRFRRSDGATVDVMVATLDTVNRARWWLQGARDDAKASHRSPFPGLLDGATAWRRVMVDGVSEDLLVIRRGPTIAVFTMSPGALDDASLLTLAKAQSRLLPPSPLEQWLGVFRALFMIFFPVAGIAYLVLRGRQERRRTRAARAAGAW
jgi:hypothetical protein